VFVEAIPTNGRGMRVLCVNAPTYWGEMETGDFAQRHKGVFLTNTRHAWRD